MRNTLLLLAACALAACTKNPQTPESERSAAPPIASQEPAPVVAPAYDLDADRARIAERAERDLGRVQTTVAQDTFVLVAPPGWNAQALASSRALAVGAIDAYYNHRFDKRPEKAIAVYLFPNATSYDAFCNARMGGPCSSKYGSYHSGEQLIVMNAGLGLGTLTHELVHPIVEADFPGAPTWINEGIASLFEAPVITKPGEITGVKNWRLPILRAALSSVRLDALFGMSDATFRDGDESLHYALARYVCQWLDQKGWLFPFYRAWRDGAAADPTGAIAFESITKMKPADAHAPWLKWVSAL